MLSFIGWLLPIDIDGWPDEPPFELPFVFELTLNIGFGMDTFWVFDAVDIDCRLRIVDPVDLFFDVDLSNADLVIFFGCNSEARSL